MHDFTAWYLPPRLRGAARTPSPAVLPEDEIAHWLDGLGDPYMYAGFADLCDAIIQAGRLDPAHAVVVALRWAGDENVHGQPRKNVPTGVTRELRPVKPTVTSGSSGFSRSSRCSDASWYAALMPPVVPATATPPSAGLSPRRSSGLPGRVHHTHGPVVLSECRCRPTPTSSRRAPGTLSRSPKGSPTRAMSAATRWRDRTAEAPRQEGLCLEGHLAADRATSEIATSAA
jgi:hypothetical protein